jgi:hypothetical protein
VRLDAYLGIDEVASFSPRSPYVTGNLGAHLSRYLEVFEERAQSHESMER